MLRLLMSFVGLCLVSLSLHAQNYIPTQAYALRPIVEQETQRYFPDVPNRSYIPALIEHESCITLKHKKCWNSGSKLSTSRELGVGLGQITKAYKPDGSIRFDSLYELRTRYKQELKEASWETIEYRADLQIRMIALMSRDNYGKLYDVRDPYERLAMADSAYNGGLRDVQRSRRQCGLTRGCDSSAWFGHVERHSVKSTKILYGDRSARDINLYHVTDVMKKRMPKYEKLYWN